MGFIFFRGLKKLNSSMFSNRFDAGVWLMFDTCSRVNRFMSMSVVSEELEVFVGKGFVVVV